jgi:hypothetical protein
MDLVDFLALQGVLTAFERPQDTGRYHEIHVPLMTISVVTVLVVAAGHVCLLRPVDRGRGTATRGRTASGLTP